MKAKRLNFQQLLKLTKNYMHRRGQALVRYLHPFKTKRGRPTKYPDDLILTLLFLQVAWKLSFRDLEHFAVQTFGRENVPDFSTYYYRLKKLPPTLLIDFLNFISRRLLGKYHRQVRFLIVDGTGFKYDELYPLKILRGHKIGDKAYDSVRFIELVTSTGLKPYVKVKESSRKSVRSEVRLKAKRVVESEGVYRYRGLVESIFGEIKQEIGSYERTRSFHLTRLFVVAKFILFNLWVLSLIRWIFQTLSDEHSKQRS